MINLHKFGIVASLFLFSTLVKGEHNLIVSIENLKNSNGQISLELTDDKKNSLTSMTKIIADKKCIITIPGLKPGKYALRFFHDENKNNKMDTNWFGIPKEGFGFSNNPNSTFGPPAFDATIFEVKSHTTLKVTPTYLFK